MNPESSIKYEIQGIVRFTPRTILLGTLLVFLVTSQLLAARFAIYFMVSELIGAALKKIIGLTMKDNPLVYRPAGGHCMGCGTLYKCSDSCVAVENQIGMPSGHSLTTMMALTFWVLYIWKTDKKSSLPSKIVRSIILVLLAIIIVLSRSELFENCHTWLQIIIGGIIGVVLGIGFYFIEDKLQKKMPETA